VSTQEDELRGEIRRAARTIGAPDDFEPVLERPRDPAFGDWATSAAMVLAKQLRRKPRDIAEALVAAIDQARAGISSADIAGPGFINFRVATASVARGLAGLVDAGESFGRSATGKGSPANVEFVSANPTGPLHVGHGRQAALGDAIAALLEHTGWTVTREFYYNDAGAQIQNLALSVQARAQGLEPGTPGWPADGYAGDYIREIAEDFARQKGDLNDLDAVRLFAVGFLRKEQDIDLQKFGVKFDSYYLESSLYTDGRVERTVQQLAAAGKTY